MTRPNPFLARLLTAAAFALVLAGASCTPPIESRVALSDPGETPIDERLIGAWSADGEFDEWGQWLVRIARIGETDTLNVLVSVVNDAPEPHWFLATAHASELAGARFLNFRRVPGIGDDYTRFEPGTCRLVHPDQAPGYIIARWDMPDDDTLMLHFIGRDPMPDGEEDEDAWLEELGEFLSVEDIALRQVNVEEFEVWSGDKRTVIETPRERLAALIERETPEVLFARSILSLKGREGPVAALRRVSREARFKTPPEPGSARYNALSSIMDLQIAIDDIAGATLTAGKLIEVAECFDAQSEFATIGAKLLLAAAGLGAGPSEAETAAAVAANTYEDRIPGDAVVALAELRLRLGDGDGAADELLRIARSGPDFPSSFGEVFLEVARARIGAGDRPGARQLIERAVQARPDDLDALLSFAELPTELGFGAELEAGLLAQALALAGEDPSALVTVAEAQAAAGDTAGALVTLGRAAQAAEDGPALVAVAKAQTAAGDTPGARSTLQRAADAAVPAHAALLEDWRTLRREAEAHIAAGDTGAAVAVLERAAGILGGGPAKSSTAKAAKKLAAGDTESANANLEAAENQVVDIGAERLIDIARAQLAAGDGPAAGATLRRIPDEALSDRQTVAGVVDLQIEAGDRDAAVRNIGRYRELEPGDSEECTLATLTTIARWHRDLGNAGAREAVIQQISDLTGDELIACSYRFSAWNLREIGQAGLANSLVRRALEAAIAMPDAGRWLVTNLVNGLYRLPDDDFSSGTGEWSPGRDRALLLDDADWLSALAERAQTAGASDAVVTRLRLVASMIYADVDAVGPALEILEGIDIYEPQSDVNFVLTKALPVIAAAQSRGGDLAGARATLDRIAGLPVDRFSDELGSDVLWFRPRLLYFAAAPLAERGEEVLARETLTRAGALLTSDLGRLKLFGYLADAQYGIGDTAGARDTARMFAESIALIPDPADRAEGLRDYAGALLELGDAEGAKQTAARAFEAAQQIPIFGD